MVARLHQALFAVVLVVTIPSCASYYLPVCEPLIDQKYLDGNGDKAIFISDVQMDCYVSSQQIGVQSAIEDAKDKCESGLQENMENDCRLYDINGIRTIFGWSRELGLPRRLPLTDPSPADLAQLNKLDSLPREAGKFLSIGGPPLPRECLYSRVHWALPMDFYDGVLINVANKCDIEMRANVCIPYRDPDDPDSLRFWTMRYKLQPNQIDGVAMDLSEYPMDKRKFDYRITICPESRKCGRSCPP